MEKWKAVQKKWVWQTTVDRNIGGHTARIPDSYTFYKGSGPRGIGVDLSSKGEIDHRGGGRNNNSMDFRSA